MDIGRARKGVVRVATQKVKPDPGILERQDRPQRRRLTGRKVGTYGLVVVVVVVVTAAAVAVWRSERTADEVPLGRPSTSGPEISGPTEPSVTGPAIGPAEPSSGGGFSSFLPKDAEPSEPEHGRHGKLVMSAGGIHPGYHVHLYADGRVIWIRPYLPPPSSKALYETGLSDTGWLERRLTPEGLELLRSGAARLGGQFDDPGSKLPSSAWEGLESEPYVPSRYAVCPGGPAARAWPLLPRRARDLLRGNEQGYVHRCLVLTTEDARALDAILLEFVGFERSGGQGLTSYSFRDRAGISFLPVLPNATMLPAHCCMG